MAAPTVGAGGQDEAPHPAPAFSREEVRRIRSLSPLPPPPPDPTNAVADRDDAVALGRLLFFDRGLSRNGEISCATCHDPAQGLADGRALGRGLGDLTRHTPTLWNVAYQRWLFWDGRADSLWAQALQPLEHPDEMGGHRLRIAHRVHAEPRLAGAYGAVFGALPPMNDASRFPMLDGPGTQDDDERVFQSLTEDDRRAVEQVFVNAGKALAAFERRLQSARSPFDRFVAQLGVDGASSPGGENPSGAGSRGADARDEAPLSPAAQRGLRLFLGEASCTRCHHGPLFSDSEFHDVRIPPLDGGAPTDPGRYRGVERVLADPFNGAGEFSDAPDSASRLRFLRNGPENWGRFRTPTLRNVARTAPYFHQGQRNTLREVVEYYSTLEGSLPPDHDPEAQLLTPLDLEAQQIDDLVAFLESLTDEARDDELLIDPWPVRNAER